MAERWWSSGTAWKWVLHRSCMSGQPIAEPAADRSLHKPIILPVLTAGGLEGGNVAETFLMSRTASQVGKPDITDMD